MMWLVTVAAKDHYWQVQIAQEAATADQARQIVEGKLAELALLGPVPQLVVTDVQALGG